MDLYEHLKNLWQTLGLVSALMVSACITAGNSDLSKVSLGEQRAYGVMWSACLMLNIDALVFSVVNLGYLLRLRSIADVQRAFTWEWEAGSFLVYAKTMLPSVFTALGALLFAAACIMTAYLKFGVGAVIAASLLGAPVMIGGMVLLVCVIIDDCREHENSTFQCIATMACPARTNSSAGVDAEEHAQVSSRNLPEAPRETTLGASAAAPDAFEQEHMRSISGSTTTRTCKVELSSARPMTGSTGSPAPPDASAHVRHVPRETCDNGENLLELV